MLLPPLLRLLVVLLPMISTNQVESLRGKLLLGLPMYGWRGNDAMLGIFHTVITCLSTYQCVCQSVLLLHWMYA